MKKSTALKSRTPILDTYEVRTTHMPQEPDVDRYISQARKIIYVNTAARPGAKITRLIP